jgi:hypothetical protein
MSNVIEINNIMETECQTNVIEINNIMETECQMSLK